MVADMTERKPNPEATGELLSKFAEDGKFYECHESVWTAKQIRRLVTFAHLSGKIATIDANIAKIIYERDISRARLTNQMVNSECWSRC